jgi:intraflagellar transport protein 140
VDARFREDRDRAGVVAFTCFAARRDERSFSKDDANASAKDEKTLFPAGKDENPEGKGKDAVCFVAPQESHVLPDGFDAVLGVAAPCLFVSRKADARAKSGDRSAPARGACFSVCMRDFEGVDAVAESNHHENENENGNGNENENDDVASSLLAFHEALASTSFSTSFSGRTVSRDPNERALRAAKKLTHPAAWLCAGRASVRRKRLDVAELCLSHTGHVRGARAARDAALYAEPDARVAAVATHLGLLEDAERLYRGCGRFDLLAELYAASGRWRDAARLAEARDRVHLRSTHYAHARHLERLGDVAGAVRAYEKSGRAHREVPRLLRARGETHALEAYVARRSARRDGSPLLDDDDDDDDAKTRVDDSRLRLWRARCLESEGDAEGALAEYLACGAFLDATRAYCAAGDLAGAAETVRRAEEGVANANANASETHSDGETPNVASRAGPSREHVLAASAFHLARAFEARDAIGEAIAYFSKAGRFGHAMRLATRHGMDGEAARLALKSVRCEKSAAETARFFLRRGDFTRAAALFAKAGSTRAAAELCFEHDLFEPLADICENLLVPVSQSGTFSQKDDEEKTGDDEEKTERSALLRRCASWLAERGRFEHAVLLEARAGDRAAALRLALEKDVKVDEKMADALVGDGDNAALLDVARLCKRRGEYALSCKLYAKAGERSKAMKALLKTGDAEKVIFFAGVSRDRDAYVMAANFLQTLDWRGDETGAVTDTKDTKETKDKTSPDIAKHIVSFYQKAKAYGHLAGFYESCAATEVDEFRDYDAALVALREARRCRAKALAKTEKNETDDETRVSRERTHLAAVDAAVRAIGRFLDARASLSDDHERASAAIQSLADDMAKESATHGARAPVATVRAGDAFAMLVEHAFGSQRDAAAAHALLAEMRARGIPVAEYVDGDMLRDIARECGKDALE